MQARRVFFETPAECGDAWRQFATRVGREGVCEKGACPRLVLSPNPRPLRGGEWRCAVSGHQGDVDGKERSDDDIMYGSTDISAHDDVSFETQGNDLSCRARVKHVVLQAKCFEGLDFVTKWSIFHVPHLGSGLQRQQRHKLR